MNIKELTREELKEVLRNMNQPAFREKQVFQWICRGAESFDECTNLSKDLRSKLSAAYTWDNVRVKTEQVSSDGTRKYLLVLPDGNTVEAVFMAYEYGNSLCISTQVGCNMGCRFCASTIGGKVRNLLAWEMLDEFLVIQKAAGAPISHIVLMGMGEPLDNYNEVAEFIRRIHDKDGVGLSLRNITLSSCGLIPEIERFGDEFPQVNLAISLHAATQKAREELMPVARRYKLNELISACKKHTEKTGRRITFEYTLIEGKNDTADDLSNLVTLLKGILCHVNIIPLNPVTETGLRTVDREFAHRFAEKLDHAGIPATVRRELGRDIDAACGQLRKKNL